MKDFIKRITSPVVLAQIISIIASLVVAVYPEFNEVAEKIVYSLTIIINLFAGVNNPTDRNNF